MLCFCAWSKDSQHHSHYFTLSLKTHSLKIAGRTKPAVSQSSTLEFYPNCMLMPFIDTNKHLTINPCHFDVMCHEFDVDAGIKTLQDLK